MTTQPEDCVYWFKTYQIDNSDDKVLRNDFKIKMDKYNSEVISRLLLGDKYDPSNSTQLQSIENLIGTGTGKIYEIITFKQRTNNGQTDTSKDTRCIYSIILKKGTGEKFDMWFAVFCPSIYCASNGEVCGTFNFWKVNFDGIPNIKLMWESGESLRESSKKFSVVTWFNKKGEKPIFGALPKSGNNQLYLSPLSFYLEGRHEDILKKYPAEGYTNGMNIYYLQLNLDTMDPQV